MSIIVCEKCDAYIDSDDDPDCFVEVGNMRAQTETKVWCESCRDKHYEESEYEQDVADAACAAAEAADNLK